MSDDNSPSKPVTDVPMTDNQWHAASPVERIAYVRTGGRITPEQCEDMLCLISDDLLSEKAYLNTQLGVLTGSAKSNLPPADDKLLAKRATLPQWRNEVIANVMEAWREVQENLPSDEVARLILHRRDEIDETRQMLQLQIDEVKRLREQVIPPRKARQSRRVAQELAEREHLSTQSGGAYQLAREIIAFNSFETDEETQRPKVHVDRYQVRGSAELRPLDDAVGDLDMLVRSMWEHCKRLSDYDVDVLDALNAVWLEQAKTADSKATLYIDDLLKMRGIKPKVSGQGRHGGYRVEERAAVAASVSRLEHIWFDVVEFYRRGRGKNKPQLMQSRAVVVSERVVQPQLYGEVDIQGFIYRPGDIFSRYLFSIGRQTALLSAMALRYHPLKEAIEKRLTRYFSYLWRVRARRASFLQPLTAKTLLEASDLTVSERNAYKTRERLEKALDRLLADGVIAAWEYEAVSWTDEDEAQGDFALWLKKCRYVVEPPEAVKIHYATIHAHPKQHLPPAPPATQNKEPLNECVRARRQTLGLSQVQAAQDIGISQKSFSNLENGHSISAATRKKVEKWLEATDQQPEVAPANDDF